CRNQVSGKVADRAGPIGSVPPGLAAWMDHGRRRVRPVDEVPRRAAPPRGTLCARCPVQYLDTRLGMPPAPTPQEGTWPQTQSSVSEGRSLGEEAAAVTVDTLDRSPCRERSPGSRSDDGP